MTTSIDKLRAEVEAVRKEHRQSDYADECVDGGQLCESLDCPCVWPCPTLKLAERMLKLAEALHEMTTNPSQSCGSTCVPKAERVLADVAGSGE